MKQIAPIKACDAFTNLNQQLPQDTLVAFPHPTFPDILVYIGGEMPRWIKKFVNAMENSSRTKKKRSLVFEGEKINLDMIKSV